MVGWQQLEVEERDRGGVGVVVLEVVEWSEEEPIRSERG